MWKEKVRTNIYMIGMVVGLAISIVYFCCHCMSNGSISFRRSTEALDGSIKRESYTTMTIFNTFGRPTTNGPRKMCE